MLSSRRQFLHQLSVATAVGVLSHLSRRELWALAPREFVPEPDETRLRALALTAIDAARSAGAAFADVRVAAGQRLVLDAGVGGWRGPIPAMGTPNLALRGGYGIRAIVDGAWGFAASDLLSPDRVAQTARLAVTRARANRPRRPRTLELAPTLVVTNGRWATPIEQDPFAVPIDVQVERQLLGLGAVANMPEVKGAVVSFTWHRASRMFASTDGTVIVQRITFARPGAGVFASAGESAKTELVRVEDFPQGQYGYEAVSRVDLPSALRRSAERAIEQSKRGAKERLRPVEVGRYDLVIGARPMVGLLMATLGEALNAERVLGYWANREGTSFAGPPTRVMGQYEVGSKLLTVRADRTQPHAGATVGWDDEGVPAEAFPLIEGGVITDYLTSRQTAAALAPAYRARASAVRSHGCASGVGRVWPGVRLPNLTLEPNVDDVTVDALIAGTKRGYYIEDAWGGSDQQVLSGQFGGTARAIRDGELRELVSGLAFQFITPSFWKSLDAIGGPATVVTALRDLPASGLGGVSFADPLQVGWTTVRAVPARFRHVNVLNVGSTT